ncbi:MAG: NADH:flavin oxidoreductase [Polyangiaceae bacterium]|nr:NADH:flavin oxidoreductase [Polyangiaceae bacterium]
MKAATYEGMTPQGHPSDSLIAFHRQLAQGEIGLTTVAYAAVAPHGRTFAEQMVMSHQTAGSLERLCEAVHQEGAKVSLQIGHCGGFTKDPIHRESGGPLGPSLGLNRYGLFNGLGKIREMTERDIEHTVQQFAHAAALASSIGFDAIEVHLGHGYLLSQFLSPALNRRTDSYGGNLSNRLRFPLRVLREIRKSISPKTALLVKMNLRDEIKGGLELEEAIQIVQALEGSHEGAPLADAVILSGGLVSHSPFYLFRGKRPLQSMVAVEKDRRQKWALRLFGRLVIKEYPFQPLYFLPLAEQVRRATRLPLVLLGGVLDKAHIFQAMAAGFDFVAIGRALIENPSLVRDYQQGHKSRSPCNHCNECVAEMDREGVRCVLPHHLKAEGTQAPARRALDLQ